MNKLDPNLAQDLVDIVGAMTLQKRQIHKKQILRLQKFVGGTDDLLADRRTAMWTETGSGRKNWVARARKKPQNLVVSIRGGDSTICGLDQAAKLIGKNPGTLACYLAKGRGTYTYSDGETVVTIHKI